MGTLKSELIVSLRDLASGPARGLLGTMRRLSAAGTGFTASQRAAAAPMLGSVRGLLAMGAGYVGIREGLGGTVGAAIKFESAFADVKKVVDASDEQFANMATTIKQMSRELPITATDLAALYAAAGESGVATSDLKAFAQMASRVGIAFDMSAGDAGDSLAKLKTQLNLSVEETGSMADAINHLSNNMASNARQITAYMLRVGKFAEMGGFNKEEVAAIGSAMISAGAEAEVAGTSMMNIVRKMTSGEFAKKDQRTAAKALGLDLPSLAKQMQKDAPKALKTVLKAIAKAPKEKQISLLSQFFGDEARAFSPLVGNIKLLDEALDSVADRSKYAGSAFKEYVARANTTANVLQLLRNKVSYVFEGVGERWLPTIKDAAAGLGNVLDTLGERANVFSDISAGLSGFAKGLGFEGGIKEAVEGLGDLLFGKVDGAGAADRLGRIFVKAEGWGKSLADLNKSIKDSPLTAFLSSVASYGFSLFVAGAGISIMAGAVTKLANALFLLSGAKAAVGILATIARLGGHIFGAAGKAAKGMPKIGGGVPKPVAGIPRPSTGPMPRNWKGPWGPSMPAAPRISSGPTGPKGLGPQGLGMPTAATGANWSGLLKSAGSWKTPLQMLAMWAGETFITDLNAAIRDKIATIQPEKFTPENLARVDSQMSRSWWSIISDYLPSDLTRPVGDLGKGEKEVSILGTPPVTISGTPQVTLTNPPPRPNVTVNAPITVNGITDLDMIGRHIQSKVREAASGIQADMVYSPGM